MSVLVASIAAVAASVDTSKLPPASTRKGVTYAKDIKPILDKSCTRCHGAERPSRPAIGRLNDAKGAKDGKVIQSGKSADSRMVHAVAHVGDKDHWMPPPGNRAGIEPLTKEQVGLIRAWIDQGAK